MKRKQPKNERASYPGVELSPNRAKKSRTNTEQTVDGIKNVKEKDPIADVNAQDWLQDETLVSSWLKKYDIYDLIDKGKGIVRIPNFLPENVAEAILHKIQALPSGTYEPASSGKYDAVQHRFSLAELDEDELLLDVSKLFWRMMPHTMPNFSVGRYSNKDHISPHDDKCLEKYTCTEYREKMARHMGCDPKEVPVSKTLRAKKEAEFSREVAVVYYLNKEWTPEYGGLFIDLEADVPHLPEFNSLVAFRVPRMHGVTPVVSKSKSNPRTRYSIFGWWLVEGRLYDDKDDIYDDKAERMKNSSKRKQDATPRKKHKKNKK